MKIEKWIKEQEEKYEISMNQYEEKLKLAIKHENPEGVLKVVTAMVQSQYYLDNVLGTIKKRIKPKK